MARPRFKLAALGFCVLAWSPTAAGDAAAPQDRPVHIAFDGEFSLPNSTSAQAIERGIRIALDEINRSGGVLGGRPLRLVTTDNRSIPARGVRNLEKLDAVADLVAVFGGRFSPVLIEQKPVARRLGLPLLAVWSSAEPVVDHGAAPSFVYRLSLHDSLAMPTMLEHAAARGLSRVGLLLLNTGWGRSNLSAAQAYVSERRHPSITGVEWFNFGENSLLEEYDRLRRSGAEAVVLVANDVEGAILVREISDLPAAARLPVISHWGVTGGDFVARIGTADAFRKVDFSVVQTFSFLSANPEMVARVMAVAQRLFGISKIEEVEAPVGFAHAYDLTHILARAIDLAGSPDRMAVRDALENVRDYRGLVRVFPRPFAPGRHEALVSGDVFMARYRDDGMLIPLNSSVAATGP